MRLYAAFRASHHLGCLAHIEFLPVTQEKRLPLTVGKGLDGFLDGPHDLRLLEAALGGGRDVPVVLDFEAFEGIAFFPIRNVRKALGPREAYSIYKGRKLLKTFNRP